MSTLLLRTRPAPSAFIEPCLSSTATKPPSGPGWIHEIKHDGYRMMVRRDAAGTRILTRNGGGEPKPNSAVEMTTQPIRSETMTDDRIAGTAKNLGGKVQEGSGSATGDFAHEVKGKLRQAEGTAQDLYGQAKDALADATRIAQDSAAETRDIVREIVEERPYTVALAAFAVGFLIGRMGRSD